MSTFRSYLDTLYIFIINHQNFNGEMISSNMNGLFFAVPMVNILKIDNYKYREILTSFFSTQQHEWPSKPAGISYQVDKKL